MRARPITAFPTLGPGVFASLAGGSLSVVGRHDGEELLLSSARAAVYQAVRRLGIRKIHVPAYNCGVEIEAAIRAGAEVEFYSVRRDMTADLSGLLDHNHEPGTALLLVHYWGFPQDVPTISRTCRGSGLILIEDCAHAMFSGVAKGRLGGFGDAAVFSLPKSLPAPDGGILVLSSPHSSDEKLRGGNELVAVKSAARSMLKHASGDRTPGISHGARALLALKQRIVADADGGLGDYGETALTAYDRGMSSISRAVLRRAKGKRIRGLRRRNFERLASALTSVTGLRIAVGELPEAVCPLFCPIIVAARDELERALRAEGVRPFVFGRSLHPALERGRHPDAEFLSRHVLGLPVHQGLTEEDIDLIARTVRRLVSRQGENQRAW